MSRKIAYIDGDMFEYEILKLVDCYDPILRKPTIPVDFVSDHSKPFNNKEISYMAMSLMKSLEHYEGLGLAANQVGLTCRMFALNLGDKIGCLINPVIVEKGVGISKFKEGCLSFPGLFLEIGRPDTVTVQFQSISGEKLQETFSGLTAVCVQHEMDHLDGICYTDLVSPIKLEKAKEKARLFDRKSRRALKQAQLEGRLQVTDL